MEDPPEEGGHIQGCFQVPGQQLMAVVPVSVSVGRYASRAKMMVVTFCQHFSFNPGCSRHRLGSLALVLFRPLQINHGRLCLAWRGEERETIEAPAFEI
jgi:hypothetical protein